MKKAIAPGALYFLVHFIVEVTSFYALTSYTQSPYVWLLMFFYDFAAFVPQGLLGFLRDKGLRVNFALIGTALTTLALVLMGFCCNALLAVAVVALGNCLVHIHGAELTLRSSPGLITPAAVFVAGGSFGVITGKLLAANGVAVPWVIGLNLLGLLPVLLAERFREGDGEENLRLYRFANTRFPAAAVIAAAVFVVAVRAFMGYGIPTSWNKTTAQSVMLFCCMGLGKALGGVLTDTLGIRATALISTLGALPLLLFGAEVMSVSLIGIACFSMTMAVTLALIVSCLPKSPGVAFGCTTVGLFLGTAPVFFFRIRSFVANCIVITSLTVLCVLILCMICAKRSNQKEE